MIVYFLVPYTPQLFDIIKPSNETRLRKRPYETEYFINEEENFYLLLLHEQLTTALNITTLLTIDTIYVVFVEHTCGMFAVLR